MRWVYHLASMGQMISAHKILVGQLELEDKHTYNKTLHTKMYLTDIGCQVCTSFILLSKGTSSRHL